MCDEVHLFQMFLLSLQSKNLVIMAESIPDASLSQPPGLLKFWGNAEGEEIIGHRIFLKSYDLVNFYLEFSVSPNDPTPRGRKPITRIL